MLGLGLGIPLHYRRRGGGSEFSPIYVAYRNRVTADGGTMFNKAICTNNKILALSALVNPVYDIYLPYINRLAADGGVQYQTKACALNKIETLNV